MSYAFAALISLLVLCSDLLGAACGVRQGGLAGRVCSDDLQGGQQPAALPHTDALAGVG